MPIVVVNPLKKIDINHNKHQIPLFILLGIRILVALVAPQDQSGICGESLFQITAIPDSGKRIGEGDLLEFEVFSLQFHAVPPQRLFLVYQVVLESTHFLQILM